MTNLKPGDLVRPSGNHRWLRGLGANPPFKLPLWRVTMVEWTPEEELVHVVSGDRSQHCCRPCELQKVEIRA